MGYFQVRYRVVNYDRRGFIRLATEQTCVLITSEMLDSVYQKKGFFLSHFRFAVPKPSFLHPDNPSNKPFVAGFNAPKPPTTAPPKPAASFNPSGPTLRPAFTTSAPSVTTVTPKPQKKIGLFGV